MMHARSTTIALLIGLATPVLAQDNRAPDHSETPASPPDRPIRNAPAPHAVELAAYIFSASNVCGYRIGVPEFEALLAKQNVKPEDVSPRGPFGARIQSTFALMSNQMAQNREQACLAVAGEYGPEGNVAKNVLLPADPDVPATEKTPPAVKPNK